MSDALAKVNAKTLAFAAKVEEAITFDSEGAGVLPKGLIDEQLAVFGNETLTKEQVVEVQSALANMTNGLTLGLGRASLKHMQANKDVERTSVAVEFGNDIVRASVDREIQVRIPTTGEVKTKFGSVNVRLESGAAAKKGDLKKVMSSVNDAFAAAFEGK